MMKRVGLIFVSVPNHFIGKKDIELSRCLKSFFGNLKSQYEFGLTNFPTFLSK